MHSELVVKAVVRTHAEGSRNERKAGADADRAHKPFARQVDFSCPAHFCSECDVRSNCKGKLLHCWHCHSACHMPCRPDGHLAISKRNVECAGCTAQLLHKAQSTLEAELDEASPLPETPRLGGEGKAEELLDELGDELLRMDDSAVDEQGRALLVRVSGSMMMLRLRYSRHPVRCAAAATVQMGVGTELRQRSRGANNSPCCW